MKFYLILFIAALCLLMIRVTGYAVQPTEQKEKISSTLVPVNEEGTKTSIPDTVNIELFAKTKLLIQLIRKDLAQILELSTEDIHLISVEKAAWRDTSLDCTDQGKEYKHTHVLGFRMILEAEGKTYEYHTDLGQTVVLCEEGSSIKKVLEERAMPRSPTIPSPSISSLSQPVIQAREDLAKRLNVTTNGIKVVEVQEVTWPDTSMGCPQPEMRYIQVPQDGLRIKLSIEGKEYEYHSGGMRAPFLCEQAVKVKPTPIEHN